MAWYVGVQKIRSGHERRRVFQTKRKVTKATFPFYLYVIGPFKSESAARAVAAQARHRPLLNTPVRRANAENPRYKSGKHYVAYLPGAAHTTGGSLLATGKDRAERYKMQGYHVQGPYRTFTLASQAQDRLIKKHRAVTRQNPLRSRRRL